MLGVCIVLCLLLPPRLSLIACVSQSLAGTVKDALASKQREKIVFIGAVPTALRQHALTHFVVAKSNCCITHCSFGPSSSSLCCGNASSLGNIPQLVVVRIKEN